MSTYKKLLTEANAQLAEIRAQAAQLDKRLERLEKANENAGWEMRKAIVAGTRKAHK